MLSEPKAPSPAAAIELLISRDDAARLARHPALAAARAGRLKRIPVLTVWHDSAERDLVAASVCLSETRGTWRLERLHPAVSGQWLPATSAPILAEAATPDALPQGMLAGASHRLTPVAAFSGWRRDYPLRIEGAPVSLSVLEGDLRGVVQSRPICRLCIEGAPKQAAKLAILLSEHMSMNVPLASLGAEALALGTKSGPAPRNQGAPKVAPGDSVGEALTGIIAHLADVILYWAPLVVRAQTEEPVHQMRVALRRLRSSLAIFRRAVRGETAWLDGLVAELKMLSTRLGVARDWDVFLRGVAAEVTLACGNDPRLVQMTATAARKRDAAYAALRTYLGGDAAWRRMALDLALLPSLRPWEECDNPDQVVRLAEPVETYAAGALERRMKHLLSAGESLNHLEAERLHEIRKQAKRLRYAIEFFAPLFPEKHVRRYLSRLEDLQEDFGNFNDAVVAAGLAASLGGGADRAFAAGAVQGFGAAAQMRARRNVVHGWRKFYRATPFWD